MKDYKLLRINLDKMLKRGKVSPINNVTLEREFLKEEPLPDDSVEADESKVEHHAALQKVTLMHNYKMGF